MWGDYSVSVILPTYREKNSLQSVINGFEALGICDEIIVINNNAEPGTSEVIKATSAQEIHEATQGYGAAIKAGIRNSKSNLIVICEPDGTFKADDLLKLLPFVNEMDCVFGTRTNSNYIWTGANMGAFLKWGNWFVAKLIELLYNTGYLSDVGCTFRVIKSDWIKSTNLNKFSDDGKFGMEILLASAMKDKKFVQVPVNYLPRIGVSGYTGNFRGAFFLGIKMIFTILKKRFGTTRFYYD